MRVGEMDSRRKARTLSRKALNLQVSRLEACPGTCSQPMLHFLRFRGCETRVKPGHQVLNINMPKGGYE